MTISWRPTVTGLAHLLAPLNVALFTVGNHHVSVAELLGFVTGAASVWLTVLARISNFPVRIANSAFLLVLFSSARLFADSGVQVVYIVLGFAGWWQWLHGGPDRSRLTVARPCWQLRARVLQTGSITERLALAVRVTDAMLARRAAFGAASTDAVAASNGAAR